MSAAPPPLARPIETRRFVATAALAVVLFVFGYLILGSVAGIESPESRRTALIALFLLNALSMLGAIWVVLIRLGGWTWSDLGYAVCAPHWLRLGMIAGFLAVPFVITLQSVVYSAFPDWLPGPEAAQRYREMRAAGEHVLLQAAVILLAGGFLVPIAEEILFRGVLYGWLRGRLAARASMLISAGVFGIAHIQPAAIVIAFVLGLVLAALTERSRSVVPAILMHQTYNSSMLMISFLVAWSP